MVHALIPSTWEAEELGFFISRPPWSTECLPGQSGIHKKSQSPKTKITKNKTKKKNETNQPTNKQRTHKKINK